MEDKPTVQMDAHPEEEEARSGEAQTPPTIPIDDMFQQQDWPPPGPQPPPFNPPPPGPPQTPTPAPAGATVVMGPPPPAPLLAWLAVVEGPGAQRGQIFALEREITIGRSGGNIVLSSDSHISGQHAKIRYEPSEEDEERKVFVLYDLASTNGTFAGDRNTYEDNQVYRYELKDDDFILLGETTLVFKQVQSLDDD